MNKPYFLNLKCIIASILVTSHTVVILSAIPVSAQPSSLPFPGTSVSLSPAFEPPMLMGIIVHPDKPFQFDFILDTGDTAANESQSINESETLVKYFLAALTIPEEDLWVNLSPYEPDKIIPIQLGQTELGRDMLAQDYLLKQLSSSLTHPGEKIGEEFWQKVIRLANERYGILNVPLETFSKVWIIPEKAKIYENNDRAFIVSSHLKVLTEEDYLSLTNNSLSYSVLPKNDKDAQSISEISTEVMKELIIPELEKEINEGKNFAQLRQIYHSYILAVWYKSKLKESLLGQSYFNQKKISGLEIDNLNEKELIYQKYIDAFRQGAYNIIQEDYDPVNQEIIPRKYFSGGVKMLIQGNPYEKIDEALLNTFAADNASLMRIEGSFDPASEDPEFLNAPSNPYSATWVRALQNVPRAVLYGKQAFARVDFNVKLDEKGNVTHNERIKAALPMLEINIDANMKTVLCSHLEDPHSIAKNLIEDELNRARDRTDNAFKTALNESDEIEDRIKTRVFQNYSMQNVALELQRLLKPINEQRKAEGKREVRVFFSKLYQTAKDAQHTINNEMKPGDILILENSRFDVREMVLHKAKDKLKGTLKKHRKNRKIFLEQTLGSQHIMELQDMVDDIVLNYHLKEEDLITARAKLLEMISDPDVINRLQFNFEKPLDEIELQTLDDFIRNIKDPTNIQIELFYVLKSINGLIEKISPAIKKHDAYQKELFWGADFYFNEASATLHRGHASTLAPEHIKSFVGPLVKLELDFLIWLKENVDTSVIGGKNIKALDEKLIMLTPGLLAAPKMRKLLTGGQVGLAFLKAQNELIKEKIKVARSEGNWNEVEKLERSRPKAVESIRLKIPENKPESTYVDVAMKFLTDYPGMIEFPTDLTVAKFIKSTTHHHELTIPVNFALEPGWEYLDDGPDSIERYDQLLSRSTVAFWNGPRGLNRRDRRRNSFTTTFTFENQLILLGRMASYMTAVRFSEDTKNGKYRFAGGGGTLETIDRYGLTDDLTWDFKGGGSSLNFIGGKPLPGYESLIQTNIPETLYDYFRIDKMVENGGILEKGIVALVVQKGLIAMFDELETLLSYFDLISGLNVKDKQLAPLNEIRKKLLALDDPLPRGRYKFIEGEENIAARKYNEVVNLLLDESMYFQKLFDQVSITRESAGVVRSNGELLDEIDEIADHIKWTKHNIWNLFKQLKAIKENRPFLDYEFDINGNISTIVSSLAIVEDDEITEILRNNTVNIILQLDLEVDQLKVITMNGRLRKSLAKVTRNAIRASVASKIDQPDVYSSLNSIRKDQPGLPNNVVIRTKFNKQEDTIIIEIEDDGIGISAEDRRRILQNYFADSQKFTINEQTYKVSFGRETGKGLNNFELLIQEMGGAVEIEAKETEGTIIRAIIPVYRSKAKLSDIKLVQPMVKSYQPATNEPDRAEINTNPEINQKHTKGGIDLNPEYFKIQHEGTEVHFDFSQQPPNIHSFDFPGLVPNIKSMTPIPNIMQLLKISNDPDNIAISKI